MDYQELIQRIAAKLSEINPYKAIVFGSVAYGEIMDDSDVDIIVVLNQPGFPADYTEKMNNHRLVRRILRDINKEIALDIIVFTIDEWDSFLETGSYFSRMISEKGKAIA